MQITVAEIAREAGLVQVAKNAEPKVTIREGLDVLRRFLAYHEDFIWEEFRLWTVRNDCLPEPHHPNWWGALCMAARRQGLIRKTGEYRSMRTKSSHARETPVYEAA